MANEIAIDATIRYEDSEGTELSLQNVDSITLTTKLVHRTKQNVGTSEEALKLGDVSSLGWLMLKNLDETNYIEVKTGTGGTVIGKMLAGESFGPIRVGSGVTAPYVVANTAACQMEIFLSSS